MRMNDLMTLEEAGEMLRRTPSQMRWLRHSGNGPKSAKLGGRVYYRRSDLEQWIEDAFERENTKKAV